MSFKKLSIYIKAYLIISVILILSMLFHMHNLIKQNDDFKKQNDYLLKKTKAFEEKHKKPVLRKGERIKPFFIKDLNRISHDLPDNKNNTLLFIFSTRCKACEHNAPNWVNLYTEMKAKNTKTVGLSLSNSKDTTIFIRKKNFNFPISIIYKNEFFKKHLKIYRYPQTILFNPQGEILKIKIGVMSPKEIEDFLNT